MAISLGSNLALHTRLPLDDRTIMETIEEMKDYPENFLPDIAYCFVKADGKMYVFNRENESTELTGKWRVLEGSGGGTADVPIEKIKVNGELQTPVNKVVDITVPDAYDDTDIRAELSNINTSLDGKLNKTFTGDDVANKILSTDKDGNVVLKNSSATAGKSAYEIAVDNGFVGTETEWLESLKGSDGTTPHIDGTTKNWFIGDTDTGILAQGTNGKDGKDGKSISTITKDDNIEVWFNPNGESSSIEGTAETTTYTNADYPSYTNVDLALDALFSKVYYVKPTCSLSASKAGGTFEMGTTITAPITFTWTTNKAITSQTLTGCTLADASVRTTIYNTNVTSDKTFTLSVSDDENFASSSVSYKFLNNIFWGSASTAETYDSAFISALSNKKLASAVKGTYSFNIANGEYGFWAVPSNMTISSVWIGGFEVTVDSLGTVSYTNAQGYTRDYNLYKTGKSGLGSISAEIK